MADRSQTTVCDCGRPEGQHTSLNCGVPIWEARPSGGKVAVWPSRERQALEIAYQELRSIGRLGGFKKSTAVILAKIEGLVPELVPNDRSAPSARLAGCRERLALFR